VKIWTAHTRSQTPPVLLPEAFSWGAAIFGPLWLLAHRAWIPAVLLLCAGVAVSAAVPEPATTVLGLGLAWLTGLFGRDLCRWSLERRGFRLARVVAAGSEDEALARLLDHQPDLAAEAAR
jgi:hypothetical protein